MKFLINFIGIAVFTSCIIGCKNRCEKAFSVDCIILDMDNNPLVNRQIDLLSMANSSSDFTSGRAIRPIQTKKTDDTGVAHFNVEVDICVDFTPVFVVVPKDDSEFKAVNFLVINEPGNAFKTANSLTYKSNFNETLRMDKLKPLNIRYKSTRNDIVSCSTTSRLHFMNNNDLITYSRGNFVSFTKNQTAMALDTTINVSGFAKQAFKIETVTKVANGETFKTYDIVDSSFNRDSVFLITIL